MKVVILFLLNFYINILSFDRGLFRILANGRVCRYSPTCSQYTYAAVSRYGILKGLSLGFKRILKCR